MISRGWWQVGVSLGALLLLGTVQAAEQGYWELTKQPQIEQRSPDAWHPIPEFDAKINSADVGHVAFSWRFGRSKPSPWRSFALGWDPLPGILLADQLLAARVVFEGTPDNWCAPRVSIGWGNSRVVFLDKPGEARNTEFKVPRGIKGQAVGPICNAWYFAWQGSHIVRYTYVWKEGVPPAVPPVSPPPAKPIPKVVDGAIQPDPKEGPATDTKGKPGKETPAKPLAGQFLGQWVLSIGGIVGRDDERKEYYRGSLSLASDQGRHSGVLSLPGSGSENLAEIVFAGDTVTFTRPGIPQRYEGKFVAADRIDGILDHKGAKQRWWATRGGAAPR